MFTVLNNLVVFLSKIIIKYPIDEFYNNFTPTDKNVLQNIHKWLRDNNNRVWVWGLIFCPYMTCCRKRDFY